MKIILPDGFEIPENTREGEPFEAVAIISPSEDGSFTLSSLNGVALAEEEEMADPEAPMPIAEEEMADPDIRLPFE